MDSLHVAAGRAPETSRQKPGESSRRRATNDRKPEEEYPLCNAELASCPKFFDEIIFGQHTAAEKEARGRLSRQRDADATADRAVVLRRIRLRKDSEL